jgi:hypothetical protein
MNRFATLPGLTAVLFVAALASTAATAWSDSFVCFCGGTLQRTSSFTESGASCWEAEAGVSIDTSAAVPCDACCFHPEISCTQQGDGSWQATGFAYYICAGGGSQLSSSTGVSFRPKAGRAAPTQVAPALGQGASISSPFTAHHLAGDSAPSCSMADRR